MKHYHSGFLSVTEDRFERQEKQMSKYPKTISISFGHCYSWGKTWKRHWYDEEGNCYRCGANREEVRKENRTSQGAGRREQDTVR